MQHTSTISNVSDIANVLNVAVEIPHDNKIKTKEDNLIIIVIDKSYSMNGGLLSNAKQAALNVVNNFYDKAVFNIISYSDENPSKTKIFNGTRSSKDELINSINLIKCDGGTCFRSAFNGIEKSLDHINNNPQCSIIFFTDGLDTSNRKSDEHDIPKSVLINSKMNNLIDVLKSKTMEHQIHCIGLGSHHDAVFMGNLANSTPNGTFQYVQSSNFIQEKLNNLYQYLESHGKTFKIIHNYGQENSEEFRIIMEQDKEKSDNQYLHGKIYLDTNIKDNFKLIIDSDDEKQVIDLEPTYVDMNITNITEEIVEIINQKIINGISKMSNVDINKEELNKIKKEFEYVNSQLDTIFDEVNKIKIKPIKARVKQRCLEIKNTTNDFWALLRKKMTGSRISNEDIAKMNDTAYSGRIKKGLQRKLDKRAVNNEGLIKSWMSSLESNALSIDDDQEKILREKYNDKIKELGQCPFSLCDIVGCVVSGDSLCIPIKIKSRSQYAIADPSKIIIGDICSGLISAYSFKDLYEYKLKETRNPENVHGGFGKETANITLTTGNREEFNSVFVLYIGDEMWNTTGRIWNKMMCALSTTLDPLAYSFDQVMTFPFLVLEKALSKVKENDNEYNRRIYNYVLETCKHIILDASKNEENSLMNKIKENYNNFMNNANCRTIDIIPSLNVFLMHIHTLQYMNVMEINDKLKFTQLIAEEYSRRIQNVKKDENSVNDDKILELFDVNMDKWINSHLIEYNKYMEKSKSGSKNYKSKFISVLNANGITVDEEQNDDTNNELKDLPFNDPDEWTIDEIDEIPSKLNSLINWGMKNYANYVEPLLKLIGDNNITNIEELGINTNIQKFTFFLQNYMHSTNSTRRYAIENNEYYNPFDYDESKKFISTLVIKSIKNKKNAEILKINKLYEDNESEMDAYKFATSSDLYESIGAFMSVYIGRNIGVYSKALEKNSNCPYLKEKILILITGKYNEIRLFNDKDMKNNYQVWKPKKNKCFKIWNAHKNKYSKEEWIDILKICGISEGTVNSWYYLFFNDYETNSQVLHK